jgi:hypothetical protein
MHVTQKTDRTHHISSPPPVWVLASLFTEGSKSKGYGVAKRQKLEEFGGAFRNANVGSDGCRLFLIKLKCALVSLTTDLRGNCRRTRLTRVADVPDMQRAIRISKSLGA